MISVGDIVIAVLNYLEHRNAEINIYKRIFTHCGKVSQEKGKKSQREKDN